VEVQSSFNATGLALGAREMYSFDMLTWQPLSGSNWAYYSAIELEADGLIEYVNDACANTEVFLVSDSLNEDDFTDGFLTDNAIRKYESTDFFSVVKANETLVIVSNENSEQCSSILMWVPLQVGSGQNLDSDEDVTSGPCQGELTVNYYGYDYELVEIGDQCWFAENCRFLPAVSPMELGSEDDGASHAYVYDFYSSDLEVAKATFHYESIGVLYNLFATISWQICPSGWRIPSFLDWQELDVFTGYIDEHTLYRNGLNYSGLSIDFGGDRNPTFGDLMTDGWYWLGEPLPSEGNVIRFSQNESFVLHPKPASAGCSVRCIKDQ
jgi:uncharacterized protein (TIGR02145 family)